MKKPIRFVAVFSLIIFLTNFFSLPYIFAWLIIPDAQAENYSHYPAPAPNPILDKTCGLDIALVIDSSDSINQTELGQMKTAFRSFVDALLPNTPVLFSVVDFDGSKSAVPDARILQTFTDNAALIHNAINAPVRGGSTNWEDALIKAKSVFDPRPDKQNLVLFSSDGNPNVRNANYTPDFQQEDLDAAIIAANEIKNSGARIVTLGIGNAWGLDALNPDNLKAISSNDAYYNAADFNAGLISALQKIATDLCNRPVPSPSICPTSTPSPTISPTPISTGSPQATSTPRPSTTPFPVINPTQTPTPSPNVSVSPTPSPSPSISPSLSPSPSASPPTGGGGSSPSPSPSVSPSPNPSTSPSPTPTPSPTASGSPTPSPSPTPSVGITPTPPPSSGGGGGSGFPAPPSPTPTPSTAGPSGGGSGGGGSLPPIGGGPPDLDRLFPQGMLPVDENGQPILPGTSYRNLDLIFISLLNTLILTGAILIAIGSGLMPKKLERYY